jgi:Domain of unknown function (DUF4258)
MIEEGFSEQDVVSVLAGDGKILESYEEDKRCLTLGHYTVKNNVRLPLHVDCDYSNNKLIDVVTAYIPQKPWWITPTRRGLK